ncbi:MAG: aspartate dehydrogenase [Burkholderiales bacterium]
MKLALIGFGGLGSIVAKHLGGDTHVRLVAVAARAHQAQAVRALLPDARLVSTAEALIDCGPDLVVECASHDAFHQYAEPVLRAGVDLIAVSVGVLAEAPYREEVLEAARDAGATLEIPAGAIGAIDVVAAARAAGLDRVAYVTRKNAKAWRGTPAANMVSLDTVREPTLFFDETAERAALVFTDKANVCATLALAGLGFERTRVQFWLDPRVTQSVHRIEAEGACGTLRLDLANNVSPSDGKASLLTAMSIVRAVRNRSATLRV